MVIALTGFMGSGKTTVGRIVADALGCPFVDLDEVIVKKAGRSIPDLFATEGEAGFRTREWQALQETVRKDGEATAVLSLGGGTIIRPEAARLLQEKALCIYLRATWETLQERLQDPSGGRPLAGEGAADLYRQRLPLYESAAHLTLDTDGLAPEEIADEIIISCL
ncbi:MAG: shikimate kinase [Bacteroidales bacterium]|nr:shikimate kinase [Bacteroidales bacterium]